MNWEVGTDACALLRASQVTLVAKNLPANAGGVRDVGSVPWRRACQPTPVFMNGESHGQRSLLGYIPWVCKELDTTEVTERQLVGSCYIAQGTRFSAL